VSLQPALVGLDGARPDEAKATLSIGKDPDHPGPALDLVIRPLQHVDTLQLLVMSDRQAIEGERLCDVFLRSVAEAGMDALPPRDPGAAVLLGPREVATVMEPAELLQAVVIGFPRHVVESTA